MLSAEPVLQERHRRDVAERGMEALPVVERLDVVEQSGLRIGPCTVAGAMHPLMLFLKQSSSTCHETLLRACRG